jgi:hypothetical protein
VISACWPKRNNINLVLITKQLPGSIVIIWLI